VFIDRDGTLTEEVGYVNHPSRIRLLPQSAEAIRRLNRAGMAAVVVTNQSGVARGYFSEEVLASVNAAMVAQLKAEGAYLDGLYVCAHHPTEGAPPYRVECDCRKPKPGLLMRAAADLGLDLRRSWMVGDKPSDLAVGHRVGARTILVLTGYGRGEWEYRGATFPVAPDHVVADLLEATERIVGAGAGR
jgi:D-glycero-D-manno-heptose 1,7-bisphosphate phosphatase